MAYIEPIVLVYQEYATLSVSSAQASLPACIVGPCYHVIDADADETLASVGTYTIAGLEDTPLPNNKPGAIIDPASVVFKFKNPVWRFATKEDDKKRDIGFAPQSVNVNSIECTEGEFPTGIAVGDTIRFRKLKDEEGEGTEYEVCPTEFRVVDFDEEAHTILLNRTAPENLNFAVYRNGDTFKLSADSEFATLNASMGTFDLIGVAETVGEEKYLLDSADLFVGYKALRQDLSDVGSAATLDEAEAALGKATPENPLAYGVSIAMANTDAPVYFVGVDSDDLAGYTAAKDRLEELSPLYGIVPLTMNTSVLAAYKLHAVNMSEPESGQWRVAFGCSPLPDVGYRLKSWSNNEAGELDTEKTTYGTVSAKEGKAIVFTDPDGTFMSSSVDAGDTLTLYYPKKDEHDVVIGTEKAEFTVAEVASDDILTVTPTNPFVQNKKEENGADKKKEDGTYEYEEGPIELDHRYYYDISYTLDKSGQASAIAETSRSFGSSRFVHVWPPVCTVKDGDTEKELPGYYLCCAVAGAISGLQPHYGFTRLSLSGADGLKFSNSYFNKEQLNAIADGGTFIFVQASPTAVPHIRHQLTTDRSAIEFQELSFVKNYDYVCYILKDILDEYIGRWNITPSLFAALRTAINGALTNLEAQQSPKIGAPVLAHSIKEIKQLPDTRDRVEVYVDVTFPYPLNTIGLHIVSQ